MTVLNAMVAIIVEREPFVPYALQENTVMARAEPRHALIAPAVSIPLEQEEI